MVKSEDQVISKGIKAAIRSAGGTTVKAILYNAWLNVDAVRLGGNCSSTIAVIEHYLYARWAIASDGPKFYGFFLVMRSTYAISKLINAKLKEEHLPVYEYREGSCPESPVSLSDWDWTST